jgi:RNA polymerase sigma factor for flagellar operon FliA
MKDREKLIESCLPLVIFHARRIALSSNRLDLEDAIGEGYVGLVQAADSFDSGKGAAFSTYASIRIRGAILDAMRRASPGPRRATRDSARYEILRAELTTALGRDPDEAEIWARLDLSDSQVAAVSRIHNLQIVSMNTESDGSNEVPVASNEDIEETVLRGIEAQELWHLVQSLRPREREVVRRYYFLGESLKMIGVAMGVSESRISQLRRQALERLLKMLLGATQEDGPERRRAA